MDLSFLGSLGIQQQNSGVYAGGWRTPAGDWLESSSPIDGSVLASVSRATLDDYEATVQATHDAFLEWRTWPAPQRGEGVRCIGEALRQ